MELIMKQHDTRPAFTVTLTNGAGVLDLTQSGTVVQIVAVQSDKPLFSRTVAGTSSGVVTMPWQTGDTAVPEVIKIEVQVTWPDLTVQTFPAEDYLTVRIVRDLG